MKNIILLLSLVLLSSCINDFNDCEKRIEALREENRELKSTLFLHCDHIQLSKIESITQDLPHYTKFVRTYTQCSYDGINWFWCDTSEIYDKDYSYFIETDGKRLKQIKCK